ncbi:RecX family transcriptional regulator [Candidatus Gracilibacteria bacterium]|nr:RecX family transcriptional regulator [Candidatus Gracilibacteria bacterium]
MKISQKIIDYAIWYYLRYYPSRKKLFQKLAQKFGPESEKGKKYGGIGDEEISYILDEHMRNIIQEEEVLRSKIKNLQAKGKNVNYIKNNLLEKYFEKTDIENCLEQEFQVSEQSILSENVLHKKIQNFKQKGKSKNYIRQKFIERSEDREVVEHILDEIFGEDDEFENLKNEYEKLAPKYEKQKIIEKLLRKGFCYGDIKNVVE